MPLDYKPKQPPERMGASIVGVAVGAALSVWHEYLDNPRPANGGDRMRGSYLGPRFSEADIQSCLDGIGAKYTQLDDEHLMPRLAELLEQENVLGWLHGRMEFGPRALGGAPSLAIRAARRCSRS